MAQTAGCGVFHPVAYLAPRAVRRKPEQIRDGAAMAELWDAVSNLGFVRGSLIRNTGGAPCPSHAGPTRLYGVATRPPLSDTADVRKYIERSGSELETAILNMMLRYFARLDREFVTLNRQVASELRSRDRSDISFYIYGRTYNQCRDPYAADEPSRRFRDFEQRHTTAGFIIRDRLWADGPQAVVVFGIDGTMTFAVCHLLRTKLWPLLEGEGLTMLELIGKVPNDPQTFDFVDDWQFEILLDRVRTNVPPPSSRAEAFAPAPLYSPDFIAASLKASA